MQRPYRNPGDTLVKLRLVNPIDLEPTPDRALQGRLDRVLRSVGANGELSVRARMITAVSNTRYKTLDGDPVSLVGLHGKDELLVLGPSWAVEKLGQGEEPTQSQCSASLRQLCIQLKDAKNQLLQAKEALLFLHKYSKYQLAEADRAEFRELTGYGQAGPAFLVRPSPRQDTERLKAEYADFVALTAALDDAKQALAWPFRLAAKEETERITEEVLLSLAAELEQQEGAVQDLTTKAEAGGFSWWFSWTTEWKKLRESLEVLPTGWHYSQPSSSPVFGGNLRTSRERSVWLRHKPFIEYVPKHECGLTPRSSRPATAGTVSPA